MKAARRLRAYRREMTMPHPDIKTRIAIYEMYWRWLPHFQYQSKYGPALLQMLEQNNRHINEDKRCILTP